MSLSNNSMQKLKKELITKDSIIEIIKELQPKKKSIYTILIRLLIFFIFSTLTTILTILNNNFSDVFLFLTNLNITMCTCLLGLLIAGFSIIISSLHKNSLYCLIISHEDGKSQFKNTILTCMEPLIWFTLLLIISIFLQLLYYEFHSIDIYFFKIILKFLSLFTIIIFILEGLCSLEIFILNMYNLLVTYANWEVLERFAENRDICIETLITEFENKLNDSTSKKE